MTRATTNETPRTRIGIAGSGFISRYFTLATEGDPEFEITSVLTRRPVEQCTEFPRPDLMTNALEEFIERCDVVLECSGDPIHATDVVEAAFDAGRAVVTMNSEFHVTAGSYFVGRGRLTEAEGDQPGCLASLHEDAVAMGFRPLVYGNMKGFLNTTPTPEDMQYWGARQGLSLPMVTAFTDGTKVQFEQALVANRYGATVAEPEMLGPEEDDLPTASNLLAERARAIGTPISDYVLSRQLPHGVFVVAEHDAVQQPALAYYKLGDGPNYTLIRNNIFVHLEIKKTLRRVIASDFTRFLDNSERPAVTVVAIAKHELEPGTRFEHSIGSFDVRGAAWRVEDAAGIVPVGLLAGGVLTRRVEPGAPLTFDDVEIPDSRALTAWRAVAQQPTGITG